MKQIIKQEIKSLDSEAFSKLGVEIDEEYIQTLGQNKVVAQNRKIWKETQKEIFMASLPWRK